MLTVDTQSTSTINSVVPHHSNILVVEPQWIVFSPRKKRSFFKLSARETLKHVRMISTKTWSFISSTLNCLISISGKRSHLFHSTPRDPMLSTFVASVQQAHRGWVRHDAKASSNRCRFGLPRQLLQQEGDHGIMITVLIADYYEAKSRRLNQLHKIL